ncbi:MAG: N-acetylmuramoyl-L-alanine amidase, partial [Alcanivorax sp.]|nr:N-acetylmuramoyl-L-alanine amidase [Alcanivorax sp.]
MTHRDNNNNLTALFVLLLSGLWASLGFAQTNIDSVRLHRAPDHTRIVFDLPAPVDHKLDKLANPDRIVLDLLDASLGFDVNTLDYASSPIANIRVGKHSDKTRVVFDMKDGVRTRTNLLKPIEPHGWRLVVDLFDSELQSAAKTSPEPEKKKEAPSEPRLMVVAIDAGHGGEDPGAIGRNKTREKDVVLRIARELKKAIDAEPGMRGVLTRDGDYYIPLRGRYEIARKARADLFISIHADAFKKRSVKGSSVFVLSPRGASSEFARLLADSENASDLVGGVTLRDKDDMLASVLLDLSQSATRQASNKVAADILGSLKRTGKIHKPHVGRANFMVLKSPDVPSVLVETAFISNPGEEKRLTEKEFQQRMARAITRGVR